MVRPESDRFNDAQIEALLAADDDLAALAGRLVRDGDDADDARQETWLAATQRGRLADRGWLAKALRFRVLGAARRLARRRRGETAAASRAYAETTPADLIEREALRRRLTQAILALAEPQRRVILLRYFDGLTPREVATRVGAPVETVRTRLRRAVADLRSQLDRDYGERSAWVVPLAAWAGTGAAPPLGLPTIPRLIEGVLSMSTKAKLAMIGFALFVVAIAAFFFGGESSEDFNVEGRATLEADADADARRAAEPDSNVPPDDVRPVLPATSSISPPEPAPEEVTSPFGRLELRVVHAPDDRPARRMALSLLPFSVADPFFAQTDVTTDDDGRVILDPWPEGTTLALPVLGQSQRVKVERGKATVETIRIKAGQRIEGRVVDATEAPQRGAEIFIADMGHEIRGTPAAVADEEGRFLIDNIEIDGIALIGARASGRIASPMILVMPSQGATTTLRLQIGGPAARLELEVVDEEDRGIAGAVCAVERSGFDQFRLPDGRAAMNPSGVLGRTDDAGRFVVDGFSGGPVTVIARAPRLAPQSLTVELIEGNTLYRRVRLGSGGRVEGRVVDAKNRPVAAAEATLGTYGSIDGNYVRTDADGCFRFENVAAGTHAVRFEKSKVGEAKRNVAVAAGGVSRLEIRLDPGATISGIVVDDAGNPTANLSVSVTSVVDGHYSGGFARTDEHGAFRIAGLELEHAYDGEVRAGESLIALTRLRGVMPGGEPIRIVVPRAALGSGRVRGRILTPDGKPATDLQVSLVRDRMGAGGIVAVDGDGRFSQGELPPGPYLIRVHSAAWSSQTAGDFELHDGDDLDLGEFRLQGVGRVLVRLHDPDGRLGDKTRVWARRADGSTTIVIDVEGGSATSQPMAAGDWLLSVREDGIARRAAAVDVRANEVAEVDLTVESGRSVVVTIDGKGPDRERIDYDVRDAQGNLLDASSVVRTSDVVTVRAVVPKLDVTIEVVDSQGRRARVEVATGGSDRYKVAWDH